MDDKLRYPDAARVLGLSLPTLYSMVSRGQIPHIRLSSRLVLFERGALEDFLAAHRVPLKPKVGPGGNHE